MAKQKATGGWHNPAPYETTHMRVPVPLKETLQPIIDDYRDLVLTGRLTDKDTYVIPAYRNQACLPPVSHMLEIVDKVLDQKKGGKESLKLLLKALYGFDVMADDYKHVPKKERENKLKS